MSVTSMGATPPAPAPAARPRLRKPGAPPSRPSSVPEATFPVRRYSAPFLPALAGPLTGIGAVVLGAPSLVLAVALAWSALAVAVAAGHRRARLSTSGVLTDLRCTVVVCFAVSSATVAGLLTAGQARRSIAVLVGALVAAAVLRLVSPRAAGCRRIVVVGSQRDVDDYLSSRARPDVRVVGRCVVDAGPAMAVPPTDRVPTTTGPDTLDDVVAEVGADTVLLLPGPELDAGVVRRICWRLEHSAARIAVQAPVSWVSGHRVSPGEVGGRTVLELAPVGAPVLQARVKQLLDRVVAAALLVVAAPLLITLLVAVRADSRGPGLFVQTRVGKDGRLFRMVKLRSMHSDAEAMKQALFEDNDSDGVLFKIRRDPRVTRVGYWLRRTSLDELPQLLNVVRGEMALVGPRPALPSEVASYDGDARRRLAVKPGITGLWQVSGRSDLSWEESLRLDLHYVDNWRLVDDVSIAVRTLRAVLQARGAY